MSGRWYPRFVKGNPQLRVFLPDWKLIMVKPEKKLPANVVSFKVDPRMTDWDIKNYLEKIYKVPIAAINSEIHPGKVKKSPAMLIKEPDFKLAHISLPIGTSFTWPDLFPSNIKKEDEEDIDSVKKQLDELVPQDKTKSTWFE